MLSFLPLAWGSELVHLRSGFDLEAQSHSLTGSIVSLQTSTGEIALPQDEILGIESFADPVVAQAVVQRPDTVDLYSLLRSAALLEGGTPEFSRLVQCVAQVESNLRQHAKSVKGATGLMQLMPETARQLGVVASDLQDNIRGGAKYLKELLVAYHYDSVLALAAYNAGPGAVNKYGGVPPFQETREYIRKVLAEYAKLRNAEAESK